MRTDGVRGQLCVRMVETLEVQVRVVTLGLRHRRYPLEQLQARFKTAHLVAVHTLQLDLGSETVCVHH